MNPKSMRRFAAVLPLVTSLVLAVQVNAAGIFTSRASWEAATPGFNNLDFDFFSGNGSFVGDYIVAGNYFDALNSAVPLENYAFTWGPSSGYDIGSGKYMLGGFSVPGSYRRYTDITPATGFDSFGLDVSTYGTSGWVSVTAFTTLGTYTSIAATPYGGSSFVGFQLSGAENLLYMQVEDVASASGGTGHDNFVYDNFSYGNSGSSSVPDSGSTLPLLGLGLVGLVATARRHLR